MDMRWTGITNHIDLRRLARRNVNLSPLPIHPLHHPPDGLQRYASIGIGHRNLRRHVEPSQSRLPRLELDERLSRLKGISPGMIPEQHSDRLQAGELCFARLISLLLGDPRSARCTERQAPLAVAMPKPAAAIC